MYDLVATTPELRKLLKEGRQLKLPKDQVVQSSHYREALTLIEKGYVKRYSITNAGNESIQSIYGPGDIFPLTWVFKTLLQQPLYSGPETFYYGTITDVSLNITQEITLKEAIAQNPLIYRDLFAVAGKRFQSNIHNLENISLSTIEKRLAHQLLYYARENGESVGGGTKLLIPLTHKDFASILDITRESVSVNFKYLREKKLISTNKGILVRSMEELENFVYS